MVSEQTTSPDLLVTVDRAAPDGLATQLVTQLRAAVAAGRLAAGTVLPSTRRLATDLSVSRSVVVEAYEQLVAEGRLVSRVGAGTRVADPPAGPTAPPPAGPAADRCGGEPTPRWDFRPGVPDLAAFPRAEWLRAARAVLATLPSAELGYGDPRGHPRARAEIAGYLGRVRGVRADPESIVLTNGMAQGMRVLAETFAAAGIDAVAVEDPSHPGAREQIAAGGVRVRPVPVDEDGLDVDALRRTGVRAVLTSPAHQFPTGVVLGAERRRDLVCWARSTDGYVIEDDYDAEYRYDREPVGAVAGLDPERVCYAGTASKSLAPSVRIGWLALPAALVEPALHRKYLADLNSPALDQLTLAEMIRTGAWDRHLRRTRRHYRARRDLVDAACARAGWPVTGIAAGLHCVLPLPAGVDDTEVAARAAERSVRVYPLSAYRVRPGPPGLLLGYGGLDERGIAAGLARLLGVLRAYRRSSSNSPSTSPCTTSPVGRKPSLR